MDLAAVFRDTELFLHSPHDYARDVGLRAIVRLCGAHPDRERWILANFQRGNVKTKCAILSQCVPRSPEPGETYNEMIRLALRSRVSVRRDAIRLIGVTRNMALIDDLREAVGREKKAEDREHFGKYESHCRLGYQIGRHPDGDRTVWVVPDLYRWSGSNLPPAGWKEGTEHEIATRLRNEILDPDSEDAKWRRAHWDAEIARRQAEDPDYMTRQPPEFVDESDPVKRRALVQWILKESKANNGTAFVSVDQYFDGNLNEGSIGCNIEAHPGISVFWSVLRRIAARSSVHRVLVVVQRAEIIVDKSGDADEWPYSDTVCVCTSDSIRVVRQSLKTLQPDAVTKTTSDLAELLPRAPGGFNWMTVWWD